MPETIFEVVLGETLGSVCDFANAKSLTAPTLVRGVSALLRLRLFEQREPYPFYALDGTVRWLWAMDTDFSEATAYKILAQVGEWPQVAGGNSLARGAGVATSADFAGRWVKYIGDDGAGVAT